MAPATVTPTREHGTEDEGPVNWRSMWPVFCLAPKPFFHARAGGLCLKVVVYYLISAKLQNCKTLVLEIHSFLHVTSHAATLIAAIHRSSVYSQTQAQAQAHAAIELSLKRGEIRLKSNPASQSIAVSVR